MISIKHIPQNLYDDLIAEIDVTIKIFLKRNGIEIGASKNDYDLFIEKVCIFYKIEENLFVHRHGTSIKNDVKQCIVWYLYNYFEFSHREISSILGCTTNNSSKINQSANEKIKNKNSSFLEVHSKCREILNTIYE